MAIGQELALPTTSNSSTAVVHANKDKSIDSLFKRILPNILFMLKDSNYKNNKKYETISILREYHNDNLDIVNNDPMLNSLSEIIDLTNQEKDEQEVNELEEKEDTDVEDSIVKVKNKNKKVLREIQKRSLLYMLEAIKQNRRRNKLIKKRVISCRSRKLN